MKYDFSVLEFDIILEKLKTYSKTNYAKRKIEFDLIAKDYDDVLRLGEETKEAFDAIIKYSDIPLGGVYDVFEAINYAKIGGMLKAGELLDIVFFINACENVLKYFKKLNDLKLKTERLEIYLPNIIIPKTLASSIKIAIDQDGNILDNASRDLFMIRRSIRMLETRLRNKLNELLISNSKYLSDNIITSRNGKMTLPIKAEYKNHVKGVVVDMSSSSSTVYIEPEATIAISSELDVFRMKETEEIKTILKNLSLLVSAQADELLSSLEAITYYDIVFAKAQMSIDNNFYPAKVVNDRYFKLINAKHPLIDKNVCVPINIELKKGKNAIVITGPNTGGKTVAMKTVGLLHIMAYYGLMVPASADSIFAYYSKIFADIGDEQSIAQSLSTFSSHMNRIINIINEANDESLAIFDEIGSGTDPKEGANLAKSIIEYLKNRGIKIIASTHYSDLKNYAYEMEDIVNASVEFDIDTLKPTYHLNMGISGKSNAILIAKRLGLNEDVINLANSYMEKSSTHSSNLISNLEENMINIKEKEEELDKIIKENEKIKEELKNKKIEIEQSKSKIINKAKEEAQNILIDAKQEAKELLDEIKDISDKSVKEHEIAALKNKVNKMDIKNTPASDYEFKVGDYVLVLQYQKHGTIAKIKGKNYTVNLGQFSMDFAKDELEIAIKPEEKEEKKTRLSGYNPARNAKMSLDLRGKRYEEVNYLLDKFLDEALYANFDYVTIIHGFGTGTVRKAVWEFLKTAPGVKSYRYGGEGEGLNGVTVVYFK